MVYNFVAAINTLMKNSSDTDEGAEDRFVMYLCNTTFLKHIFMCKVVYISYSNY